MKEKKTRRNLHISLVGCAVDWMDRFVWNKIDELDVYIVYIDYQNFSKQQHVLFQTKK